MVGTWAGKISPGCGAGGCQDCPTEREPMCVECPECVGKTCEACGFLGSFELCECPRRYVGRMYWELLRFGTLFRKGMPPITGGVLDQESWFMGACEFLWGEQDRLVPPSLL